MENLRPGGKIIVSPDITPVPNATWIAWIRAYIRTLWQRSRRIQIVDRAIESIPDVVVGYTIHALGHGRYVRSGEGIRHKERAFIVELLDVDPALIEQVARTLRRTFAQEAVAVVDYRNNSAWFVTD